MPCSIATAWSSVAGSAPSELWCADFKGEFKLGNGHYCYPLTVTDHASRFLLLCEALESTREELAFTAFERLFAERGALRSDNGVPFTSPMMPCSMSPSSRSGGSASASPSNASSPGIRSERPPRAHASDPEEGSHSATRPQQRAATGSLRRIRARVQCRAAARSAGRQHGRDVDFLAMPADAAAGGDEDVAVVERIVELGQPVIAAR